MKTLADLKSIEKSHLEKLQAYKDCDPILLQQKRNQFTKFRITIGVDAKVAIGHANRWTVLIIRFDI